MKKEGKRLTKKELEMLLSIMRHWTKPNITVAASLAKHFEALEYDIERLSTEIRRLRDVALIEKEKQDPPLKLPPPQVIRTDKHYFPLSTRLKKMFEDGKKNSPEWQRALKWNGLTEQNALDLIRQEQEKIGIPQE